MYENIFKYKHVLPRRYIKHLEIKLFILDNMQIEATTTNYKQERVLDNHFTSVTKRLSREQKKLKDDTIINSDADVWDRNLFDGW